MSLLPKDWQSATMIPLAGDASSRRYSRLYRDPDTAILMEDPTGDTALFARLARHLTQHGLSAPQILFEAPGLLLLEDLGDSLFASLCEVSDAEQDLYTLAIDVLIHLQDMPVPDGLQRATPASLAQATDLAYLHYAENPDAFGPVKTALEQALTTHAAPSDCMVHRDFHAENLLYLPHRDGVARVGVLDFQDALIGHRAYDLASLLRDARREVSATTCEAVIQRFLNQTKMDEEAFRSAFAVLSVQRNLRILGIFARLSRQMGKTRYVDLIPRVWKHLQTDLAHPAAAPLRPLLMNTLPAPSARHLDRLRTPCQTQ